MIKFRFLVIVLIILATGVILQVFNIVNFPKLFQRNILKVELVEEPSLQSSENIPDAFDKYIVIYSSKTAVDEQVPLHVREVFRNSHIQAVFADAGTPGCSGALSDAGPGDSIIVATAFLGDLASGDLETIARKVEAGTNLTILVPSNHPGFASLAGIDTIEGGLPTTTRGLSFVRSFFPAMDELESDSEFFTYSSLNFHISDSINPIAVSGNNQPLIWQYIPDSVSGSIGKVLYTNSSIFQEKVNRGLMLQMIMLNSDYAFSFITGVKMLSIDDWPAPLPEGKAPIIWDDYLRDNIKFYKEVWWTDLQNLEDRYGLGITGFLTASLDTTTEMLPDGISADDKELLSLFGTLLSDTGGELGILGYNPTPLTLKQDITPTQEGAAQSPGAEHAASTWSSEEDIRDSLEKVDSLVSELFDTVDFLTYTAPDGIFGSNTKSIVIDEIPRVQLFSGVYTKEASPADNPVVQEFGPDPDIPGYYTIPRFSYGYTDDPETTWPLFNGIAELGMVNHAISSLDLITQPAGEEVRWSKLLGYLEDALYKIPRDFPFLTGMTCSDSYLSYKQNENLQIYSQMTDSNIINISLDNAYLPMKLYFHCDRAIASVQGGLLKTIKRDDIYILEVRKPDITIKMRKQ